ncbi:uncharacterized protein LOC118436052 [Folsomia candida]|uniref:Heat shock 70 kDa protein n=1 Tax=Folsomia candida TaxID=158441 RepID=A0A226EWY3_FOLCA|nr:uncharacterized protein LOC118436052 [Folsomia candida]OXA61351.1 Heat shock 70 kDa protein [Folsomia candida]
MESFKLKNCFRKLVPIIADELSEEYNTDDDGTRLSKVFDIDAKFSLLFQKHKDVKLRTQKIIHYWILINGGNPTVTDLLTLLDRNGMSKAKNAILTKISIGRSELLDNDEPGHISRLKEIAAASEIFYDNQSLLVYGEIGVGKTYFVKRLLKIAFHDSTLIGPKDIIVWLDFTNFLNSLEETCLNLGIDMKERQPYDLVTDFLKAQPDFVIVDGFSFTHELGLKYLTLCQDFQKEFYFKLIVITDDEKCRTDFDVMVQIKPFDEGQVLKFLPELGHLLHEITDHWDRNAAVLKRLKTLMKEGTLTEEGLKMLIGQNFKIGKKDTDSDTDVSPKLAPCDAKIMASPIHVGEPVQIVNFKLLPNQPSRLVLHKQNLEHILRQVGNTPICLISIAGASRQGKSFLLTVVLNALECLSRGQTEYWKDLDRLNSLSGFHFKNGTERDTVGLWLWSKPFFVTKSDRTKIAVMLMDTQGVFDAYTTERDWAMIVGLSLITSSCLIYNLFTNIQEDTLKIFHNFVEFGMLSLEEDSTATSAFQKLIFLIRDWNFPNTHAYGPLGGSDFLEKKLSVEPNMPPEVTKVRQTLTKCFEEISCFLMPNPGEAAKENNFSGALSTLSEAFRENLRIFVDNLITFDDLKPIKIGKNIIDGTSLLSYFEKYIEVFNGKTMPPPKSLYQAMEEARLGSAITNCCEQAKEKLETVLKSSEYIPSHEFKLYCDTLAQYKAILAEKTQQTLLEQELEDIIEFEKKNVLLKIRQDFERMDDAFQKEAESKIKELVDIENTAIRDQNSTRFKEIERICQILLHNCTQQYYSLMNLALGSDLKNGTHEKLRQTHKTCESMVLPKFMGPLENESQIIRGHFHHQFNSAVNQILGQYAEKFCSARDGASSVATNLYKESFNAYTTAMTALAESGTASETDLKMEHQFRVLEACHKLNQIHIICSPEEGNEFENNMREETTHFYDNLIADMQKHREQFVQNAVEVYDREIKSLVHSPADAPLSNEDFVNKHEEILGKILSKVSVSEWITAENRPTVKTQIIREVQNSYQVAQARNNCNLEQAELTALEKSKTFLAMYDVKMDALISRIVPPVQQTELESTHKNLEQEIRRIIMQTFANLPKYIADSILAKLKQDMNNSFANFKEKLDLKAKQDQVKMSQLISDHVEMYESDMNNLIRTSKNITDAELVRFHERSKSTSVRQLGYVLRLKENFDREQVQKELEEKIEQVFSKIRKDTSYLLKNIDAQIFELRKTAKIKYQKKIKERQIDAQNEEEVRKIHEIVLSKVLDEFEHSFAEIGDMQRFRQEKVALQSELQDLHRKFVDDFLETNLQNDKKIRHAINDTLERYKTLIQSELDRYYCVSDTKLQTLHDRVFSDVLKQFQQTAKIPLNSNAKVYDDLIRQKINEAFKLFKSKNIAKNESLRNTIKDRVVQLSKKFEAELNTINKVDDMTLKKTTVKYIKLCVDSVTNEFYIDDDASVAALCESQMTDACMNVIDTWKQTEVPHAEADFHLHKARDTYIDEMDKSISSRPGKFLPMAELHKIHIKVSTLVKDIFENSVRQTPKIQQRFHDMLHDLYRKYDQDNTLRASEIAEPSIGIDLGTTYSCAAIYDKGKIIMIPDHSTHKNVTPSYVLFENLKQFVVGESAKDQAPIYPDASIFDIKRLIGRKFTDAITQKDIKTWPFKVVCDGGGKNRPKIEVFDQTYHPEEISAKILQKLKDDAEKYLGRKVENAVITVPAYFNDAQKLATKNAGNLAGLKVMGILNEPTSAAIAYSLNYTDDKERNILVYDLGGGTFDVSVLTVKGGDINVRAVGGNNHLGGEDFDTNMLTYCIQEFQAEHNIQLDKDGIEYERNSRLGRIRARCEKAKINLSVSEKVKIVVDRIYQDYHLQVEITREKFNELNEPLFQKTLTIVGKALEDAKMEIEAISDVVLVGGSTRIPRVQEILKEYLKGKSFNLAINPDEVVAQGAAILAAMKSAANVKELGQIQLSDVAPFSLGIEVVGGRFSTIIKRNTKVPCNKTEVYVTSENQQTVVKISIYEGEDKGAANNNLLGKFVLSGIPPAPAGKESIDVTMSCDAEGILHVTATCNSTGGSRDITIKSKKTGLTEEEMKDLKEK